MARKLGDLIKPSNNERERSKDFQIKEQREYPVVKANKLIQKSRYSLSLHEQKLVLHLIQKIRKDDKEFQEIAFTIKEYCEFMGIDKTAGKNYVTIKKSLKNLSDKSFWVKEEDGSEFLARWIKEVEIESNASLVRLKLDERLKPYLLDLQSLFTQYNYYYVMTMRSQYSIRLYELIKSYENQIFKSEIHGIIFSIEELRERFDMEKGRLNRWVDFKRNVIEQAVKEINLLTDIQIRYEAIKKGRAVADVAFYVEKKEGLVLKLAFESVEKRLSGKTKNVFDEDAPY